MTKNNTKLHKKEADIAANLKRIREASGDSIRTFAGRLDEKVTRSIHPTTYADMENGKVRIDSHSLLEASKLLGCSPLEILGETKLPDSLLDDEVVSKIAQIHKLPTKEQKRILSILDTLLNE